MSLICKHSEEVSRGLLWRAKGIRGTKKGPRISAKWEEAEGRSTPSSLTSHASSWLQFIVYLCFSKTHTLDPLSCLRRQSLTLTRVWSFGGCRGLSLTTLPTHGLAGSTGTSLTAVSPAFEAWWQLERGDRAESSRMMCARMHVCVWASSLSHCFRIY